MARLSYGWDNPNHAAAVFVCLIPLFMGNGKTIERSLALRTWLYVVWFGEAFVSLLLALTYSRGGGLAWLASLLFFRFDLREAFVGRPSPEGLTGGRSCHGREPAFRLSKVERVVLNALVWASRFVSTLAAKRFINVGQHASGWRFLLPRLVLFGIVLLVPVRLDRRFALVAAATPQE